MINWKVQEEGGSVLIEILPWQLGTHKKLPVRTAGAAAKIRHDQLPTHEPLSSLRSGESYERRTVSWLQVECSPQMGQVATYSVCSCVTIQIGSTYCKHVWWTCDVSFPILAISLLAQSVHIGDSTKIDLLVAVVVLRWRKLVYDVTSQKTCGVMYSATRVHDVTSVTCDVTCSTTLHVAIHRRHVT